jgi:hypothetical protein
VGKCIKSAGGSNTLFPRCMSPSTARRGLATPQTGSSLGFFLVFLCSGEFFLATVLIYITCLLVFLDGFLYKHFVPTADVKKYIKCIWLTCTISVQNIKNTFQILSFTPLMPSASIRLGMEACWLQCCSVISSWLNVLWVVDHSSHTQETFAHGKTQ